jgi:hypothetical protein
MLQHGQEQPTAGHDEAENDYEQRGGFWRFGQRKESGGSFGDDGHGVVGQGH